MSFCSDFILRSESFSFLFTSMTFHRTRLKRRTHHRTPANDAFNSSLRDLPTLLLAICCWRLHSPAINDQSVTIHYYAFSLWQHQHAWCILSKTMP